MVHIIQKDMSMTIIITLITSNRIRQMTNYIGISTLQGRKLEKSSLIVIIHIDNIIVGSYSYLFVVLSTLHITYDKYNISCTYKTSFL